MQHTNANQILSRLNIQNDLQNCPSNLELVICCGKIVGANGEIDWVLESRLRTAVAIAQANPDATLLLSGGISLTSDHVVKPVTEAEAMSQFIQNNFSDLINPVIIESDSTGTLEQLCIIKANHVLKNDLRNLAIVSDEFHIKRVGTLFDAVLGDGFNVSYFGSRINLFGKYREVVAEYEEKNFIGAVELVDNMPRGDHETFWRFDSAYRELRKARINEGESRLTYISPSEVLTYIRNKE